MTDIHCCRYSREVGSHQVNLDLIPASFGGGDTDLSGRYQPDPTFRPRQGRKAESPPPPLPLPRADSGGRRLLQQRDLLAETHVDISAAFVELALSQTAGDDRMPQVNPRSTANNGGASQSSQSGIVNKPARGWLHPDHHFAKEGINYVVRVSGRFYCVRRSCFKFALFRAVHRLP